VIGPVAPALAASAAALVAALVLGRPTAVSASRRGRDVDMEGQERGLLLRIRPVLVALGFAAGWAFVGGPAGVLAGLVVAAIGWQILERSESPAARRRREILLAEQPTAVQLLAECLRAGAAVGAALRAVAEAMPGPCGEVFAALDRRLALGTDPAQVWAELAADPEMAALGRTLARAHETGASIADAIDALAADLRARARSAVEERAKSVDVRASAPLGVCFLPAFVVLGVVPLVASLFASMRLFD